VKARTGFCVPRFLVQRLMDGAMPGCPRLSFGIVDVRDVAELHLRAMTSPAAKGERFLAVWGDFMSILDMAKVLKARRGRAARARAPIAGFSFASRRFCRPCGQANHSRAGQDEERHEHQGKSHARLAAAFARGRPRRHGGKPASARAAQGKRTKSGVRTDQSIAFQLRTVSHQHLD
jgi:nucleoside-diphosphate-sugar epimerase